MIDPLFRVEVISQQPNPQQVIYAAAHQDYAECFVWDEKDQWPSEEKAGELIVKMLLNGGRGHYGPLEHPQIVLNCGWFGHSTMQQIRTHRVGVSFDVQSFRYTGQRLYSVGDELIKAGFEYIPGVWGETQTDKRLQGLVEEVIYLRPEGHYTGRKGDRYWYTEQARLNDLALAAHCLTHYVRNIDRDHSEEHARGLIPFDVRQHWVMSANVRSLMHLLDLRWKADAQLECQWLCDLIWPHFEAWVPAIAKHYMETRAHKARLAP